jgi:hypothetical protein
MLEHTQKIPEQAPAPAADSENDVGPSSQREVGGRTGPDPTRFGDWELRGRCIDF